MYVCVSFAHGRRKGITSSKQISYSFSSFLPFSYSPYFFSSSSSSSIHCSYYGARTFETTTCNSHVHLRLSSLLRHRENRRDRKKERSSRHYTHTGTHERTNTMKMAQVVEMGSPSVHGSRIEVEKAAGWHSRPAPSKCLSNRPLNSKHGKSWKEYTEQYVCETQAGGTTILLL